MTEREKLYLGLAILALLVGWPLLFVDWLAVGKLVFFMALVAFVGLAVFAIVRGVFNLAPPGER